MLSKSLIWLTAPMQQRSKSGSDWLNATAAPPVFRKNVREATKPTRSSGRWLKKPVGSLPHSDLSYTTHTTPCPGGEFVD